MGDDLHDDSGDGVGTDAEHMDRDGPQAARIHVGAGLGPPSVEHDPALAPLVAQRRALEDEIAALRAQKRSVPQAAYERELERLLIELARVSREIRDAMQEL